MKQAYLAIAGVVLAAAPALAAPPPALYTAAQATAGATLFSQNCAMCHGDKLQGMSGPALIGQNFAPASSGLTIGGIFSELAEQMPATNPGSLTQDQYEDLMAYILSKNGYPAGAAKLDYKASLASAEPLVSAVK